MSVSTVIEPSILKHFRMTNQQNSQKHSQIYPFAWNSGELLFAEVSNEAKIMGHNCQPRIEHLPFCSFNTNKLGNLTQNHPNRKGLAAKVHSFQDFSESLHLKSGGVWKFGGQPLMTDENHKHSCLQGERNVVPCATCWYRSCDHVFCLWDSKDRIMESSQIPCKSARSLPLV